MEKKEEETMTSAVGPSYFYEDEVFRINKNGEVEFGMVTENWEMYSSDEEEEESEPEKVPHGHVAVTWHPKGKDEVVQESKVKLGDRSLMPGDVVRRLIAGKDTQRGYCRSVRVSADVQVVGCKKVIPNVAATSLLPVQKLQSEVAVYLDSWIGVVRDVKYLLNLKFSDNSACTVDSDALLDQFEDIRRSSEGFGSSEIFYPGQRLRGAMKHLKEANWSYSSDDLKRAKDRKIVTVVVTDVQPISLNIQWQWQTPRAQGQEANATSESKCPPSDTVDGEDLQRIKCLNLFESCTVQLGDISYYTPSCKDVIWEKAEWKQKLSNSNIFSQSISTTELKNSHNKDALNDECLVPDIKIANQDGCELLESNEDEIDPVGEANNNKSFLKDNPSTQITSSNTKKVVPKVCTRALRKKKLKKAIRQQPVTQVISEAQTVVETLHTQSVVDVVWQDGTYEEGLLSIDLYPIHHLDDHEFFPGDFVVMADSNDFKKYGVIQNMDHSGRVAVVKWFEAYSFSGEQKPKEVEETEMSVYDIKDHPDFRFRPGTIVIRVANMQDLQYPAGQILDNYPDGQARVWWANGVITPCWPQDLFRLGDYDSDEGEMWDDAARQSDTEEGAEEDEAKDANSDSSWETDTEEEVNDGDASQRYQTIGRLIEHIQKTLVCTREAIVASSNVSVSDDNITGVASPIAKLGGFDERGLTKKLLLIYKDCQYLDKIMETKFFDVEDLKSWYKDNESASAKSRRMIQQISRLFDVPLKSIDPAENEKEGILSTSVSAGDIELKSSESSATKLPSRSDSLDEFNTAPGMLLYELCSIILRKLVEAHNEYEKRFGGFKSEHVSATQLLSDAKKGIEAAFTECLGKQFLKRHLNKAGCSRLHHELAYRFVLSAIDDMCNTSSTGGNAAIPNKDNPESGRLVDPLSSELVNGDSHGKSIFIADVSSGTNIQNSVGIIEPSESTNFAMIDSAPDTHRYRLTPFQPQNQRLFIKTVQKEVASLRESLPDGIYVKAFEDRMDLYSVMVKGPEKTPYEDGLFLFDIHLPPAYPSVPPMVHYIAFCTDRLNPNLYEEGKVCVSLLGTWSGKGTEVWTSSSSLLQLFVSIQGLILGNEPYYNEAGYDKQRGTQQGGENSRMYNENVLIKLVQSMSRMVANPPSPWEKESIHHIKIHGPRLIERYSKWLALSDLSVDKSTELPGFSLLPVSKGFSITLKKTIASFGKLLTSL